MDWQTAQLRHEVRVQPKDPPDTRTQHLHHSWRLVQLTRLTEEPARRPDLCKGVGHLARRNAHKVAVQQLYPGVYVAVLIHTRPSQLPDLTVLHVHQKRHWGRPLPAVDIKAVPIPRHRARTRTTGGTIHPSSLPQAAGKLTQEGPRLQLLGSCRAFEVAVDGVLVASIVRCEHGSVEEGGRRKMPLDAEVERRRLFRRCFGRPPDAQ
mmetsp:Transcript_22574/g.64555  ORF Transcript_22574/g.64555 Transcript_22574/m.64555 type:complete len:208 (-) Transcript_22574:768-1391(-)